MTDLHAAIARWIRVDADALAERTAAELAGSELVLALHGDTAALHDAIVGRPGDFDRLLAALARLRAGAPAPPIASFACEVEVVAPNLAALPRIVDLARELGARGCVFAAPGGDAPAMASIEEVVPAVRRALARCGSVGLWGALRRLPACLLGDDADALIDGRDDADPPRAACLFAGGCGLADRCGGLPTAYIRRFGWEPRRLQPAPRASPRPPAIASSPAYAEWRALLGPAARHVVAVVLDRRAARFTVELGGGRSLVLELTPRDPTAPAFARSRTFDIRYTRAVGLDPREIARVVAPIAAAIAARDDGALDLDPRRGLPRLPPR